MSPWETSVDQDVTDHLVLLMDGDRALEYSRRQADGRCFVEPVVGVSVWGVCVTHSVVADPGHHFAAHPGATTD